jgi:hypothetical protein
MMTNKNLIAALRDRANDFPGVNPDVALLQQAAQALEAQEWRTEFDFPQPKEREVVREIKGKQHRSMEFVPNWFWVQTKCGQVMQSYVMKTGRLHGLATDEMPVAWMPNPTPIEME